MLGLHQGRRSTRGRFDIARRLTSDLLRALVELDLAGTQNTRRWSRATVNFAVSATAMTVITPA
jgi:hypothetical protein